MRKVALRLGAGHTELQVAREGDVVRFEFRGTSGSASVVEAEPGIWSVLLNGISYEARVVPGGVVIDNRFVAVETVDERMEQGGAALLSKQQTLTAPMPARVVRVLAGKGTQVKAGSGILVIEAMKMQNELTAERDGVVITMAVQEGDTVSAGQLLAVVE